MVDATFESFEDLLDESLSAERGIEGTVLRGTVLRVDGDFALVDVGLKSEGRIALKEFSRAGEEVELKAGDQIDVFVERYEDRDGLIVLSRDKARREEAWNDLEKTFTASQRVEGIIFGRVKGGFTVDLSGAVAFLPGSQVDIRPVRDIGPLMGQPQTFQILKMDRARGNIVVSRRAVLEESRAEERAKLMSGLKESMILDGVVKNITDYGAFVDLGGVDGLLHVTDISWKRVTHPSEALNIGQTVKVQVIRFNAETQRISLGMKQLEADPWEGVAAKYPVGTRFIGRVTNITDYGAFVELEAGVEGLVHVSEMSWTKKNIHPGKIVSTSQEVEVMILDVDGEKRRISLGLKQCAGNPWESFASQHPAGTEVEGEVKNITEFGLFVGLPGEIDGMVHLSDLSWSESGEEAVKAYNRGDMVKAKVLDVDIEKERISLGIKQLGEDPFASAASGLRKGQTVTAVITAVQDNGIEVEVDGAISFIRKSDLSRERNEQRTERFAVGEKIDAKITAIDSKTRKISLSIKARELEEEKQAMAEYGSTDSGALLGDILGAALKQAKEEKSKAD
ncbi:30S ribosomal protein S1 [Haematospirillum jordaniae]|uniref:30S ribosomal protein S1 n=1 Tax=Haematospirillum jordaniae TaxID=1549855 RepID=UPI001432975C|nr:30S ribosomal protein S1 [Haematospirillum jordaniae]NKD86121.1 30S ribosomal protein S1 [Haematospirillum jordaniae]